LKVFGFLSLPAGLCVEGVWFSLLARYIPR
jgi:hypothetical protein